MWLVCFGWMWCSVIGLVVCWWLLGWIVVICCVWLKVVMWLVSCVRSCGVNGVLMGLWWWLVVLGIMWLVWWVLV